MIPDRAEAATHTRQDADTALACPHCGHAGVLTARYPHTWHGRTGKPIHGFKAAVLCATCDSDEAAARELIALVDSNGQVSAENTERFIHLAVFWVEHARGRELDVDALAGEEQRWRIADL
ncbi:DUF6300 family protein [Streptomyces sp. NPDC059649]|uniref:DUF6300 family protein n=1 Tax=Streptomyces sp. NPDC059649 TaxID=3346895 RepID=UPI0036C4AFEE